MEIESPERYSNEELYFLSPTDFARRVVGAMLYIYDINIDEMPIKVPDDTLKCLADAVEAKIKNQDRDGSPFTHLALQARDLIQANGSWKDLPADTRLKLDAIATRTALDKERNRSIVLLAQRICRHFGSNAADRLSRYV